MRIPQSPAAQNCPAGRTCSLDCLGIGCSGRVAEVRGDQEFRRRMLEMGFCNSVPVQVVCRAPFGDPIEFRLRGYCLSLRSEQARNVIVDVAADPQVS
jgi:ferrous iron transport protein A